MRMSGKSAARERRDPMNETEENAVLFYPPCRRSRDQIDWDVSQGRVYPLADVLFKFLFGRPERLELFLDLLNTLWESLFSEYAMELNLWHMLWEI